MKHLVIGGVRSGKSAFAQTLVQNYSQRIIGKNQPAVVYLATAQALDASMEERIENHKKNRPSEWVLIEETIDIASVLLNPTFQKSTILIECMTLWLTNLLCLNNENSRQLGNTKLAFLQALEKTHANVVIVTSEVGLGVMPMNAMARDFADQTGELNQTLARLCDKVTLVTAGLPLALK